MKRFFSKYSQSIRSPSQDELLPDVERCFLQQNKLPKEVAIYLRAMPESGWRWLGRGTLEDLPEHFEDVSLNVLPLVVRVLALKLLDEVAAEHLFEDAGVLLVVHHGEVLLIQVKLAQVELKNIPK